MEDQVEEIKRKTDIVGVVGSYVALKKMGRHHKGLCPFHSEKTPSFMVNEEMGLYKCFGCGAGGDVIKFLMEIEGIEFREALERLAEKAGVKLVSRRRDDNDERTKMLEVMDLAARYYHWLLMEGNAGEAAREYLRGRKINEKLMETFNIGFAMQSWEGVVNYLIKKKGYSEELLEKVGLVSRKSKDGGVYDKFRGRIMFPLQDAGGKVVGFTGRILPSLAKDDEPKYMNSPETALYHKSRMLYGFFQAKKAVREKRRAILVEGQMDCISSFASGITETVAVGGTALTEDQVELLARLADKIYLSMDADEAGSVAIKRSVELAEKRGMSIKVVQIEGGKDPDEIARKSPEKWRELVEKSVDVYEFIMTAAFKKFDATKVEGIKKITEEVVPFLAKIENGVVREVWAKRLADKIGVATKGVIGEIEKKISGKQETKNTSEERGEVEEKRIVKLARRLIGLLILRQEAVKVVAPWFGGVSVAGAEGKLITWLLENGENQPVDELVKNIPEELREVAGEAYMAEDSEEVPGQKEVEEAAVQLLREIIRDRKKEIMEEMNLARREKNEEKEDEIFAKLNELNKKESKIIAFLG
ncbi:MAG: primase protein [Candidatus Collierbacteria bacterium GW2011_GWA1_42_60]|uniref:DNA primase n=1 Tax=Candidatus Collierbacteria bacterium GW2011_GWA2_42_17 TaxID=1618378 RepID=A0A0G0Z420_9BACT|nr:MAG: primase protein [Candidatus Collierbacteria bacterium GW2011_GWB2_42_12]KKS43487.1 MAG: primase protein [Candidatus Collierbacteria bacterium GW2011_GWA2_42_17]KKS62506.1 MAG: primase protein [Candidatus Collierbacteria bacterium GW2011_GWE2_42_48]KKS62622.1 MAG: primase protein [Candidatus Collierbacteria bacterium GW2011_GWF1_42_50]KKS62787.1 MAG: primase protein [Candidatus Collierbacteria bacterium GW2011_GWD2_42_50]KKS64753.1 MAG: primase protein [Candidatus Collierbacteria bacter